MRNIIIFFLVLVTHTGLSQCFHQTTEDDDIILIRDKKKAPIIDITHRQISKILIVKPHIGFYDSEEINAVAYNSSNCEMCNSEIIESNDYGYIFISQKLNQLAFDGKSFYEAMYITAHEMGHIFFYSFTNYKNLNLTIKQIELYADFIAGFSLNTLFQDIEYTEDQGEATIEKKEENIKMVGDTYARIVFESGDIEFDNPIHHGTKLERISAFKAGWDMGKELAKQDIPYYQKIKPLINRSYEYVKNQK